MRTIVAVLVQFAVCCGAMGADTELRKACERLRAMQNLVVEYEISRSYSPPRDFPVSPKSRVRDGVYKHSEVFRFLHGRAWYDSIMTPETIERAHREKLVDTSRILRSYATDRAETLSEQLAYRRSTGGIHQEAPLPKASTIDLALGLRLWDADEFMTEKDIRGGTVKSEPSGAFCVTVAGQGTKQHRFVYDPVNRFALTEYSVTGGDGFTFLVMQGDEFEDHGGVMLPKLITSSRHIQYEGQVMLVERHELRVSRYSLNDPANTPESFHITWPKGSIVHDERLDVTFNVASGDQVLSDKTVFDAAIANPQFANPGSSGPVGTSDRARGIADAETVGGGRYGTAGMVVAGVALVGLGWAAYLLIRRRASGTGRGRS